MKLYRERIKLLRKQKKITFGKLSKLIGKSLRTVSSWETGARVPSEAEVRVLAQILQVRVNEISDLEEFNFDKKPFFFENLNPIVQVQQQIKTLLPIEEKKWIFGLLRKIDSLTASADFYKSKSNRATSIIDSLQSFVYSKNEKLEFTYVNPAYLSFLHMPLEEITGKDNSYIFGSKESMEISELEKRVLKGVTVTAQEIKIPSRGRLNKGLFSATPIVNEKGKIIGLTAAVEDITERIAAQEQLKVIEQAVNKSKDALWILNNKPIPHFLFTSGTISKIIERDPALYKNRDLWLGVVHVADRMELEEFYKKKQDGHIEYRIETPTKKIKWIAENYYFLEENNIEFGIIRDISEARRSEEIRMILEKIFTKFDEDIWLLEAIPKTNEYKYLFMSESVEKIYGYSAKTFFKNPNLWLDLIHPDDKNYVLNWPKRHDTFPVILEYRIITIDNQIKKIQEKFVEHKQDGRIFLMGISKEIL